MKNSKTLRYHFRKTFKIMEFPRKFQSNSEKNLKKLNENLKKLLIALRKYRNILQKV